MKGWMGKILRVNMTDGRITKEPLDEELAYKYVGGRGLNIAFLYKELGPEVEPLGPENKIAFAAGPACGTPIPGSQRWTISGKSPMTGFIGDANCGGSFGMGLKQAGYDMLIVEGASERLLYLMIDGDSVQLRDAAHLKGKKTTETSRAIKKELGDPDLCIASIGPAGENLVRFACVQNDNRTAGRTGLGAVMGSKGLKAVAARGHKGVKVPDKDKVEAICTQIYDNWRANEAGLKTLRLYGSGVEASVVYDKIGIASTKNFSEGSYEKAIDVANSLRDELWLKPRGGISCNVACSHVYIVGSGPYKGTFGEGLYGPALYYTCRIGCSDPDFMCKLAALSDQYGIDEADMTGVIGWLMECYEKGIFTSKDLEGLKMEWGNKESAMAVMELTTHRRGIGDIFAEGAKKASEILGKGSEKYVMHVKGISLDSRDPRGSKGWGFGYAVGSRGADHCRHVVPDMMTGRSPEMSWLKEEFDWWKGLDRFSEEDKGKLHRWFEDARAFQHALEVCLFTFESKDVVWTQVLAEMFTAVTGLDMNAAEVLATGERITNLERAFNVREGLTRKDDTLPERFLKEPMKEGGSAGVLVDLDAMLDEYYATRGWDLHTGFPTKRKLEELGLAEVANELAGMGKVA